MNRITIVETIYHRSDGSPPTSKSSNYGRMLETDELPYTIPKSKRTVGEEWAPVDCGWFKSVGCGLVSVSNLGGTPTGKIPMEDEKNDEKSRVLEVSLGESPYPWIVRPGETMRAEPSDCSQLRVRCRKGETRFTVTFFPR